MRYSEKIKERQELSQLDTLPIDFVLNILSDIDIRIKNAMFETEEYYDVKLTMSRLEDLRNMLTLREDGEEK